MCFALRSSLGCAARPWISYVMIRHLIYKAPIFGIELLVSIGTLKARDNVHSWLFCVTEK
jgi:hypothetical protein